MDKKPYRSSSRKIVTSSSRIRNICRRPAIVVLGLLVAYSAQSQTDTARPTQDPESWRWNVPTAKPHVRHGTIHSLAMNRIVGYNVFLPPSYADSPDRQYPVTYFLHGAGGDESATEFVYQVIDGIRNGNGRETIFVFVNGGAYSMYRDDPAHNVMPETLIIRELIPEIDKVFRTTGTGSGRSIAGFSMGGSASIRLALKYPDSFCAAVSISGMIYDPPSIDHTGRSGNRLDASDDIYFLATENAEAIRRQIGLLLSVGEAEPSLEAHRHCVEHVQELQLDVTFQVQPNTGHDFGKAMAYFGQSIVSFLAARCAE